MSDEVKPNLERIIDFERQKVERMRERCNERNKDNPSASSRSALSASLKKIYEDAIEFKLKEEKRLAQDARIEECYKRAWSVQIHRKEFMARCVNSAVTQEEFKYSLTMRDGPLAFCVGENYRSRYRKMRGRINAVFFEMCWIFNRRNRSSLEKNLNLIAAAIVNKSQRKESPAEDRDIYNFI